MIYSHSNISVYCAHHVLHCNIVVKARRIARFALRIDLVGQAGGLTPFLVVLVDKISTTIEYAGVEVASCGIFDVMKQRMYALN